MYMYGMTGCFLWWLNIDCFLDQFSTAKNIYNAQKLYLENSQKMTIKCKKIHIYPIFASFVKHGKKYRPIWHITIIFLMNMVF